MQNFYMQFIIVLSQILKISALQFQLQGVFCTYFEAKIGEMVKVLYNVEGVNPTIKFHLFDPINLPITNEEGKQAQITFEVLDSGEHRMCFNNNQSQSLEIDFDIEILGKEKYFLNKEKLGENVQYLNMIESNLKWIKMHISEQYQKEEIIQDLINNLFKRINNSIGIKLVIFLIILIGQSFMVVKYSRQIFKYERV